MGRELVTRHALERFQELAPDASWEDVRQAWRHGNPLSRDLVGEVTNSQRRRRERFSAYRLTPGGDGILVMDTRSDAIVTCLRLQESQQAILAGFPPA